MSRARSYREAVPSLGTARLGAKKLTRRVKSTGANSPEFPAQTAPVVGFGLRLRSGHPEQSRGVFVLRSRDPIAPRSTFLDWARLRDAGARDRDRWPACSRLEGRGP